MKKLTCSKQPPQLRKSLDAIENVSKKTLGIPEVALAAVIPFKEQKEISEFIQFILSALENNMRWLNKLITKQNEFKCALLVGAGSDKYELQEILYPTGDREIKLEVEKHDSEDHDKVAIAALMKLRNSELNTLLKYIKTGMIENDSLKKELLKGKSLGVTFTVLRPTSDKLYRVMEHIIIESSVDSNSVKKRRRAERAELGPPIKKTRKIII